MRARFFVSAVITLTIAFIGAQRAFANHDYSNTSSGQQDASLSANWGGNPPNGDGQDVEFLQTLNSGTQTNINFGGGSTSSQFNYLRLNTGGSSAMVTITAGGINSVFGLEIDQPQDTLILNGNTSTLSQGNNAFSNVGSLILSNGVLAIANNGGGATMNNAGTIQLTAASGQTSDLNYGQTGTFNNNSTGTIVKNDTGSGNFTGNFGGNNISAINNGTIIVNGGTLNIDTRGAFNDNGFHNTSSGQIFVNAGANFAIDRTTSAWNGTAAPANDGTITLNGGTFTVNENGGQNAARLIQNNNFIVGSGTLAASVAQASGGSTIATNGVLDIFGTFGGNQATFTSVSGQFGTFKAVSGGTLKVDGSVASGQGGA
jgi:hypothetical protein